MRYVAGYTSSGTTSVTLPLISVYATAAVVPELRQVEIFVPGATGVGIKLVRLSTTGTPGSSITPVKFKTLGVAASCTAAQLHTGAPTTADTGYGWWIPPGGGIIDTFPEDFDVAAATTNGFGLLQIAAPGSAVPVYVSLTWEE